MTNPNLFGEPLPTEEDYADAIEYTTRVERINSRLSLRSVLSRAAFSDSGFGGLMVQARRVGMVLGTA